MLCCVEAPLPNARPVTSLCSTGSNTLACRVSRNRTSLATAMRCVCNNACCVSTLPAIFSWFAYGNHLRGVQLRTLPEVNQGRFSGRQQHDIARVSVSVEETIKEHHLPNGFSHLRFRDDRMVFAVPEFMFHFCSQLFLGLNALLLAFT